VGQSELLAGALVGGFVLYLAMQNRLATYWALLTGGASGASTSEQGSTAVSPASAVGQVAGQLAGPALSLGQLTPSTIESFLGPVGGFGGAL